MSCCGQRVRFKVAVIQPRFHSFKLRGNFVSLACKTKTWTIVKHRAKRGPIIWPYLHLNSPYNTNQICWFELPYVQSIIRWYYASAEIVSATVRATTPYEALPRRPLEVRPRSSLYAAIDRISTDSWHDRMTVGSRTVIQQIWFAL